MPKQSPIMNQLYGPEVATAVFNRLQELSVEFNTAIQDVAYNIFWMRPGISLRDKSLVTVASLVAMGKEEQTKIHINGFINNGGTIDEIKGVLAFLSQQHFSPHEVHTAKVVVEELKKRKISSQITSTFETDVESLAKKFSGTKAWEIPGLSMRDKQIVNVTGAVAVGNQQSVEAAIEHFLSAGETAKLFSDINMHLIVYCGFPAAMNGFSALLEVEKRK